MCNHKISVHKKLAFLSISNTERGAEWFWNLIKNLKDKQQYNEDRSEIKTVGCTNRGKYFNPKRQKIINSYCKFHTNVLYFASRIYGNTIGSSRSRLKIERTYKIIHYSMWASMVLRTSVKFWQTFLLSIAANIETANLLDESVTGKWTRSVSKL